MKIYSANFWERIANARLFSWGYLAFHLFCMISMRLFLNSPNFAKEFRFWFVMFVLESIFIFGIYAFFKRFVKIYSANFVLISAFSMGLARTIITTGLGILAGTDIGVAWVFQLLLGGLFELMMVAVWANLNGAYREHNQLVADLEETRDSILGYRENAEQILEEEQEKLIERAQGALLPQIKHIEKALISRSASTVGQSALADEIRELISSQIRPLSESLRVNATNLSKPKVVYRSHARSLLAIPKRFVVRDTIFPLQTFATMVLGYLATPFWLLDRSWVIPSSLLSVTYLATIAGLQRTLSKTQKVSAWLGITSLLAIAVIAALPTYLVAKVFYPNFQQASIYGTTIVYLSVFSVAIFALRISFDYQSRGYRENLREQNSELQHEVSIFEQQLWAARRNWLLTIHGSVQSSLTAALTRLSKENVDFETVELAKRDINSAITALSKTPISQISFDQAMQNLTLTWQGVCEIEVDIKTEIKNLIAQDSRLTMCVNEIAKEAISNAVRHGDARFARISIEIIEDGLLDLTVANQGSSPASSALTGIGSSILDDFSLSWSLENDEKNGQTKLHARLPFSKAQA